MTFRELCHDIGQTMCDKVAMCSPPGDSGCAAQFEDFCCQAQTDCDQDSGGTRDELDACLDGFERLSCDDLMNGETPAECQ